jgi:ammonia channel protein AmtB
MLIGAIGGLIPLILTQFINKMKIDDCVGAFAVHGGSGIWGVISVGLFADNPVPLETTSGRTGLFKGIGLY